MKGVFLAYMVKMLIKTIVNVLITKGRINNNLHFYESEIALGSFQHNRTFRLDKSCNDASTGKALL